VAGRLRLAYQLLYGRSPTAAEIQMGVDYLQRARRELTQLPTAADEKSRSAWTGLMRVLLSSNEFFYVD
jgi:hypothetical protein